MKKSGIGGTALCRRHATPLADIQRLPATDPSSDSPVTGFRTANFITRSGTKLFLNGQQYKFAGVTANAMVFPPCRGETAFPTQGQLDAFFGQLNPIQ